MQCCRLPDTVWLTTVRPLHGSNFRATSFRPLLTPSCRSRPTALRLQKSRLSPIRLHPGSKRGYSLLPVVERSAHRDLRLLGLKLHQGHLHFAVEFLQLCELLLQFPEVDKVFPELVVRDEAGKIEGVRYDELAPMLLNEVQQQQQKLATQAEQLDGLSVFSGLLAS